MNEVVNIGNDVEVSVLELARLVVAATDSRSRIVHLPPLPEGDMSRRRPDIVKMRDLLGRELTPLAVGIRNTIRLRMPLCQES